MCYTQDGAPWDRLPRTRVDRVERPRRGERVLTTARRTVRLHEPVRKEGPTRSRERALERLRAVDVHLELESPVPCKIHESERLQLLAGARFRVELHVDAHALRRRKAVAGRRGVL